VNKKYFVRLSEAERGDLTSLVSTGRASARKLTRARILLKADQGEGGPGWTDEQIAEALETSPHTVRGVRKRFTERGSQGAINRKKGKCSPVRVRKLDGAAEARLIAIACGDLPAGRSTWSMRLLADQLVALNVVDTISHDTVWRTLKKTSSSRT
jgi:transposase